MSSTFKLNRTCPTCGCKVSDKSKTGYCTHHRPRTGENNPFFGKHHNFSEEKREEIRKKISALTFDEFNVTASLGAFNNKDGKLETIKAISLSDELLYKAKNSGKNKTETNM